MNNKGFGDFLIFVMMCLASFLFGAVAIVSSVKVDTKTISGIEYVCKTDTKQCYEFGKEVVIKEQAIEVTK
jgi:hypothetical protein